jgi:hypothetical protein
MEINATKEKSQSSQSSEDTHLVIRDGHRACGLFPIFENSLNLVWSILWKEDQQQAFIANLAPVGKVRFEEAHR